MNAPLGGEEAQNNIQNRLKLHSSRLPVAISKIAYFDWDVKARLTIIEACFSRRFLRLRGWTWATCQLSNNNHQITLNTRQLSPRSFKI